MKTIKFAKKLLLFCALSYVGTSLPIGWLEWLTTTHVKVWTKTRHDARNRIQRTIDADGNESFNLVCNDSITANKTGKKSCGARFPDRHTTSNENYSFIWRKKSDDRTHSKGFTFSTKYYTSPLFLGTTLVTATGIAGLTYLAYKRYTSQ